MRSERLKATAISEVADRWGKRLNSFRMSLAGINRSSSSTPKTTGRASSFDPKWCATSQRGFNLTQNRGGRSELGAGTAITGTIHASRDSQAQRHAALATYTLTQHTEALNAQERLMLTGFPGTRTDWTGGVFITVLYLAYRVQSSTELYRRGLFVR